MRKLFLFIMLFACIGCMSQNLIGFDKSTVKRYLIDHDMAEYQTGKTDAGTDFCSYVGNKYIACWYFDKEGICNLYATAYDYSVITTVIKQLNDNYIRQSEYEWKEYSSDGNYIWKLVKGDNFFTVLAKVGE